MYELEQGTERLAYSLYNRADDSAFIERLASLLDYVPSQLSEDIQALIDYIRVKGDSNNG